MKKVRVKDYWLRGMAQPADESGEVTLVLDHCGDLRTRHPVEKPLTLKVPGKLACALFGEGIDRTGGSIHGGELREQTFPLDAADNIHVGEKIVALSPVVLHDLFDECE